MIVIERGKSRTDGRKGQKTDETLSSIIFFIIHCYGGENYPLLHVLLRLLSRSFPWGMCRLIVTEAGPA